MKKIVALILIIGFISCQKTTSYDYIKNYYPLVYEADIAYLEKDYQKAYDLLKKAEDNCPLLNQPMYYEVSKLAELSVMQKKYDDALNYIERLIKKEGDDFNTFENNEFYSALHSFDKWKDLKVNQHEYHQAYLKTLNLDLREEIKNMRALDQRYRQSGAYNEQKCDSIDAINEDRIKEIISEYGFPNETILGSYKIDNSSVRITAMMMHFEDTTYFKKTLIPLVKQGKCSPEIYPAMVDSRQRRTKEFIYGIYDNVGESDIIDFINLDNRRVEVGLPPKSLQEKRQELIMNQY